MFIQIFSVCLKISFLMLLHSFTRGNLTIAKVWCQFVVGQQSPNLVKLKMHAGWAIKDWVSRIHSRGKLFILSFIFSWSSRYKIPPLLHDFFPLPIFCMICQLVWCCPCSQRHSNENDSRRVCKSIYLDIEMYQSH